MQTLLDVASLLLSASRPVLFAAACAVAVACALSWATRTRRVSPFSALGRFARARVDPLLQPVESSVLRAGGSHSSVPWWGLAAFVVMGILAQSLLEYVVVLFASTVAGLASGPRGAARAVVSLLFGVLQVALLIRVVSSWFPRFADARALRWTYRLTEPMLAPLRAVLPSLGPFDITPLVLYYLIRLVGGFVVSAI